MKESIKQFFKKLNETNVSKKYVIIVLGISMLMVCSYFSYAMFTVSKEKQNAIKIVTGNLTYKLTVNGTTATSITVPAKTTNEYTVVLTNPNSRKARFNFYYIETTDVKNYLNVGYVTKSGSSTLPSATGTNINQNASNTYTLKVTNSSSSSKTLKLGVEVGLDYNNLALPTSSSLGGTAKTFSEYTNGTTTIAEYLLADSSNSLDTSDSDQTFITGSSPHNYIWYSGKMWKAVSINTFDNSVKAVTENSISVISYNESDGIFAGSYMDSWLNDETVDGFLGNLREPEKFLKSDSEWNATVTTSTSKPDESNVVTRVVGSLNLYEYTMSYKNTTSSKGYLNNGKYWWLITPAYNNIVNYVDIDGRIGTDSPSIGYGIRPAVNFDASIQIASGSGTSSNPYRLEGDNDSAVSDELSARYSGEYVAFGKGDNNLYRIVSHEVTGTTKIVSVKPIIDESSSAYKDQYGNYMYQTDIGIGNFLNNDFLSNYLEDYQPSLLVENAEWYFGTVASGGSYKLAKYQGIDDDTLTNDTTTARVGLLRYGELFATQGSDDNNFVTITPINTTTMHYIGDGDWDMEISTTDGAEIKPAMFVMEGVYIVHGSGTKTDPFIIDG